MWKKIFFLLISCIFLNANEVDFNELKVLNEICLGGLGEHIQNSGNEDAFGLWYLYGYQRSKYDRVKNDEFERDDAIKSAYKIFVKKQKEYEGYIGENSILNLNITFGEYNFKEMNFPLATMTKSSFIRYNDDPYDNQCSGKLIFDNTKIENAILPMGKDEAKKFIQKRKSSSGSISRDLIAKYYYTIVSTETTMDETNYSARPHVRVIGHINKLEILDKKEKVLITYENYK